MKTLDIVTPSHDPDFEMFEQLHRSVLKYTDPSVVHHAVVPRRDVQRFEALSSSRLVVTAEESFLPRRFIDVSQATELASRVPALRFANKVKIVNLGAPWPPIRNWILQQIIKLSVAAASKADVVLLIDSDVCLIRELVVDDLLDDDTVRFYSLPGGVRPHMERHVSWHRESRRLLGLPPDASNVLPDYIAGFVTWDPALVRAALDRIASTAKKPWIDVVGSSLGLSEYTLYGTYVEHLAEPVARSYSRPTTLCAGHWDAEPLDVDSLSALIDLVEPSDHAVLIQSTSATPAEARAKAVLAATAKVRG